MSSDSCDSFAVLFRHVTFFDMFSYFISCCLSVVCKLNFLWGYWQNGQTKFGTYLVVVL
jgi:hypothetical protein